MKTVFGNRMVLVLLCVSLPAAGWAGEEEGKKAPAAAPWPRVSPSTVYVNAADFGIQPVSPDKLLTEVFDQNFDSTDGLQAALDAGATGIVFIPAGMYRVTRPLTAKSGTTIMGAGYCSTTLASEKAMPAIFHLQVSGPMTTIRDLWVCGPVGGNWGAAGIWLEGCNGVTVRDCWVSALKVGILVDGISDTWLRNIVTELNQEGIRVQCPDGPPGWASGNLRMFDCYGYQNYQAGFTLANLRGVQMQSCGATGAGYAILARNCAQVTISGAQVNFDGSRWRKYGIRLEKCDTITFANSVVEGMPEYGIAAVDCSHLSMSGNVVRNTTAGPGIRVQGCQMTTVTGNCVTESARDGIEVTGCRDITLIGNTVDLYGTDPQKKEPYEGIKNASNTNCQMVGNTVRAAN